MNRRRPNQPAGIILLVVISSLAFFSILIATFLIYSRDARQSSFVLASRNYRAPDIKDLLDEALMMQVRGTDDPNSPFFGEDLLSDFYGRDDAYELRVRAQNTTNAGSFRHVGGGYIRFPVQWGLGDDPSVTPRPIGLQRDDLFAGRLITFTSGPLSNYTHRVIRSRVVPVGATAPVPVDILYIQLDPAVVPSTVNFAGDQNQLVAPQSALSRLFYDDGATTAAGFSIHMNGVPRNSPGIGWDNTSPAGIKQTIGSLLLPTMAGNQRLGITDLAVSLQPNQIRGVDVIDKSQFSGDFDEDYDAADFNNWFLSYRNPDGTIVPSFHRPAVINYILNQTNWSAADSAEFRRGLASIARATFRPLPIAQGQFGLNTSNQPVPATDVNAQFTGSNTKYALRAPLFEPAITAPPGDPARRRLDQLAKALIADNTDSSNQWDVDNSGDGTKDSIWIDLDLPAFTSSEGKLLKPLVATRIEDLSARLNVNAHSNPQLAVNAAHLATEYASWAGTRGAFPIVDDATNRRDVFRGLGYGPAEIGIPAVSSSGA